MHLSPSSPPSLIPQVNSSAVALSIHICLRVAHKAGGGGYGKETRPHHGRGAAAAACVHSTCSSCCRLRPPTTASARRQTGCAGGGLRPPSCCSCSSRSSPSSFCCCSTSRSFSRQPQHRPLPRRARVHRPCRCYSIHWLVAELKPAVRFRFIASYALCYIIRGWMVVSHDSCFFSGSFFVVSFCYTSSVSIRSSYVHLICSCTSSCLVGCYYTRLIFLKFNAF